jgi:hypothetical protein
MNAIEFVRKFGICEAKAVLLKSEYHFEVDVYLPDMKEFTYIAINPTDSCPYVGLSDIKQIVDAFELVEYCHGLIDAKELLEEINSEKWVYNLYTNTVISADYAPSEDMCIRYNVLEKAINLVEQCQ